MRGRSIVQGDQARAILAASLAQAARAVAASLGPSGRAVIWDRGANSVEAIHSGSAIARVVAEQAGAWSIAPRILDRVLSDVARDFQDGTARTACICEAIYAAGVQASAHGVPSGALADALLDLLPELDELLQRQSCARPTDALLAEAACHDAELAEQIAALDAAGSALGVVDVCETDRRGVTTTSTSGFVIDVQPYAVGFAPTEQVPITMQRVSVLVVNDIVDGFGPFARVLEQFVEKNRSLLIVARGFGDEARATLLANRKGLGLHLLGLVPEDVSTRAAGVLEDLAIVSGATLIDDRVGTSLAELRPAMLGQAQSVRWSAGRAILTGTMGAPDVIAQHRDALLKEAERQRYLELDRDHLLRRAARMAGEWAEIHVGPCSGVSAADRTIQAKAALSAMKQASLTGVVAGGGVALARVAAALEQQRRDRRTNDASHFAIRAVVAGCRSVIDRIASNAGDDGRKAVALASAPAREAAAFDAASGRVVPLRDWAIVDPLSTTQSILRRAVSAAATMLRVETLVCT
ncbi:TCP-1/cpn60 chaperonin family protein [Rhodopseudomonas palustris]|uniref:60 kDa chaperonin n=1 Tax=Rhodopseudomonas palustris TaxID=1076 RepID=A0A418VRD9_RHOPL|nr:TCP-1/cpn60 chaperonin family protein [Rhodopseudomonas palustris]RJF78910.1 hypothetical protein D4Q52_01820 [Rhodopseudomonas palustris]